MRKAARVEIEFCSIYRLAILFVSSNHKLCHLVSTRHFNSVIQSVNTVIVLLFCYLPVFYYLPVFRSSAIPLVTGSVSVLLGTGTGYYHTVLVFTQNPIVVEDRYCAYL